MCVYGQEPLKVNQHPAKFDGLRGFSRGGMILVCHDMIFQDHVIKVPHNFISKTNCGKLQSCQILPTLRVDMSLVCHMV